MLILSISFPYLIKFPYITNIPKRRVWGERRPKNKVILHIILIFTLILTCPKTFMWGHVSVFDKCLHWSCVNIEKHIYIVTK